MLKRWILFVLIVTPIIYLLVFGLSRNPRDLPSVLVGKKLPPFTLKTLDGEKFSSDSLHGSPVVINFWASWCVPCLYEAPVLKEARARYESKGVQFLGVVYQDEQRNIEQFLEEVGEPFFVLIDPKSQMAIDYGVGGVPETFFIDREGIIRYKYAGVLNREILQEKVEELLQK